MKVGVTGFAGVGRSTVFSAISGQDPPASGSHQRSVAVVDVIDRRLDVLRAVFQPRKFTRARFEVEECPSLPSADARGRGETLVQLREPDALLLVIGAFDEARLVLPEVHHDPLAQLQAFRDELLLLDLEAVERREERIAERRKKGGGDRAALDREHAIIQEWQEALEAGTFDPVAAGSDQERRRLLAEMRLFAGKPVVPVFNLDEAARKGERAERLHQAEPEAAILCAPVEQEIAQLEGEDRAAFLEEYGLEEPASERLTRLAYRALDLISFFTVGEDEVRAWPIVRGSDAVTAAGRIHTDLARGFIRAEVTPYEQVAGAKDAREFKALARPELKGKDYVVEDGDILNIRFSV